MLKNDALVAKISVDTAENEPSEVARTVNLGLGDLRTAGLGISPSAFTRGFDREDLRRHSPSVFSC